MNAITIHNTERSAVLFDEIADFFPVLTEVLNKDTISQKRLHACPEKGHGTLTGRNPLM